MNGCGGRRVSGVRLCMVSCGPQAVSYETTEAEMRSGQEATPQLWDCRRCEDLGGRGWMVRGVVAQGGTVPLLGRLAGIAALPGRVAGGHRGAGGRQGVPGLGTVASELGGGGVGGRSHAWYLPLGSIPSPGWAAWAQTGYHRRRSHTVDNHLSCPAHGWDVSGIGRQLL